MQSTYALTDNWSLKMSISDIRINTEDVWPGDAVRVMGDASKGFDLVALNVGDVGPIEPVPGTTIDRAAMGAPSIAIALGSFTQPVPTIDDKSTPGTKIYTWEFTGYITVQTFAALSSSGDYTLKSGDESVAISQVAELAQLSLSATIDFSFISGDNPKGTCVFEDTTVTGTHTMVDMSGVLAEFQHASSVQVPTINSLDATDNLLADRVSVSIDGEIAAGAEIFDGSMTVYNAYTEFPITFKVIQTVSELEGARFGVPSILNFLPTSADAIEQNPLNAIIIFSVIFGVILAFAAVSFVYGKPTPRL